MGEGLAIVRKHRRRVRRLCQTLIVMDYLVIGADGKEYGPVDVATLAEWARADRVRPNSTVKETATGRMLPASQVPGLFQPLAAPPTAGQDWSQLPDYYRRPQPTHAPRFGGGSALTMSFVYAGAAVVFFFVLRGIGLVFAIYGVINAFRAKSAGHPGGAAAIVVSLVALAAVTVGWIVRMSSGQPY